MKERINFKNGKYLTEMNNKVYCISCGKQFVPIVKCEEEVSYTIKLENLNNNTNLLFEAIDRYPIDGIGNVYCGFCDHWVGLYDENVIKEILIKNRQNGKEVK